MRSLRIHGMLCNESIDVTAITKDNKIAKGSVGKSPNRFTWTLSFQDPVTHNEYIIGSGVCETYLSAVEALGNHLAEI